MGDGITVFDGVLSDDGCRKMLQWAESVLYVGVHHEGWRPVWRLGDGEPLRGPTWRIDAAGRVRNDEDRALPSELAALADLLRELLLPVGSPDDLSLTPWVYAPGAGLGLHRDDNAYGGSYVYYFMPIWDVHWGGLLHCVDEPDDGRRRDPAPVKAVFHHADEQRSVAQPGRGRWVVPRWNRLVTLAPHVRHFVSPVDARAGDRPRLSIAGFRHHRTDAG